MANITTSLADISITRALILERVKNGLSNDVALVYKEILAEIEAKIRSYPEMNIKNMNKIIKEIKSSVTPSLNIYDDLADLASQEATFMMTSINSVAGYDIMSKVVNESTIKKLVNTSLMEGATISDWFGSLEKSIQTDLERQIKIGVVSGETNRDIVERVKNVMNTNINHAKSITRTAVSTVSNQARQAVYEENSDVIDGYEHVSVLDSRVSLTCSSRDGAAWDLEKKGLNTLGKQNNYRVPPLHFNCRSILVPIIKAWENMKASLKGKVPESTRASMDGAVSSKITFNKWFEGKSSTFQEEYLGRSRYDLYKKGTITFSDLVNQSGSVLSISELKRKYS